MRPENLPPGLTAAAPNKTIYSGPTIPNAYDPNWQYFTNLTPAQIAWFQAQPEWQNFLSYVALKPSAATINANVSQVTINGALSAAKVNILSNGPKL